MLTQYPIRRRVGSQFFLAAFLLGTLGAMACRIIVPPWPPPPWYPPPPRPLPRPPRQPVPMEVKEHRVIIDVRRHVADITVEATFHNPNPFRIEGVYIFPVGPGAAVSSFAMRVNGRTLEADLLDADKARGIYEDIVRRLKDPALLEYAGEGLLKARVFPIEGRADVRVQLAYEVALRREGGLYRLVYPFLSAKPGGNNRIRKARIEVHVEGDLPLKNLFTPGFDTSIRRDGNRRATLTWEADNVIPDRDFTLLFSEEKGPVGIDFLSFKEGDEGYFLLVISPDSELQAEELAAKEITFVIDTSGSMMGDKIRQAKAALSFCINALNEDDRFNIIAFSTDVVAFSDHPVPAGREERDAAREFISGLRARGGTAIDRALQKALKSEPSRDRPAFTVFITDGLPTVGETDPRVILKHAGEAAGDRRIFAFGVGYDVNTRLLDGLCRGTRGTSTYVRPRENLEVALSSFYEKIAYPVMTDLELDSDGVPLRELNPPELPDLFRGGELRVTGRFTGKGSRSMVLSGRVAGVQENFRFRADLDGKRGNTFIPRMWAVSRVGYLQEQIRINGAQKELVDEIKRLGRKYGILTEYTSFLIVEDNVDRRRVEAAKRAFRQGQAAMDQRDSGALAVEGAVRAKALQRGGYGGAGAGGAALPAAKPSAPVHEVYRAAGIKDEEVASMVKAAGNKTFYLRRSTDTWVDSLIPAGTSPKIDVEIKAWSPEYFALVRDYPELSRYLRVGKRLIIVLDGRTIRIAP